MKLSKASHNKTRYACREIQELLINATCCSLEYVRAEGFVEEDVSEESLAAQEKPSYRAENVVLPQMREVETQ